MDSRFASRIVLLICSISAAAADASDADVTAELDRRWQKIADAGDRLSSRELFWFADAALENGSHAAQVEQAYAWAEQMQDRHPDSPTLGNFRWYRSNPKPMDKNAVEFCMSAATVTWIHHRDALSPTARDALERLMRFGAEGLKRHHVAPSYTNIYLEKTWNMIGVGQALDLLELREEGAQMLVFWLAYTWQNGITEYLSGTYYGVSFGPLEKIAQYAEDATARENANAALRLFWTDVAANWFEPCHRLAGACSREYNFQIGINSSLQQRIDGVLRPDGTQYIPPPLDKAAWSGPDSVRELFDTVPRMVRQRWGSDPSRTAAHYVAHRFSIGSTGATYGPMDRPLTVNIAGPARDRTPFITFLMDARGDPYGCRRIPLPSGHAKARHLSPFLTSVQHGPEVLLLASDHPRRWTSGYRYENLVPTCLQSHLTFPADMEIRLGDRLLEAKDETFTEAVPVDTPVFLESRGVRVGVRVVWAQSDGDRPVSVRLVRDAEGLRRGVMRLTCVHDENRPTGRGTVALWIAVTETADAEQLGEFQQRLAAPVTADASTGRVTVSVPGLVRPLQIVADVDREERVSLSGADPLGDALLTVNGSDVGSRLLDASPALTQTRKTRERMLQDARAGTAPVLRSGQAIEAEAAPLIEGSMQIKADRSASGQALLGKPGDDSMSQTPGRAVWVLEVPRAGPHYLWARLRTPSKEEDSFYVGFSRGLERDPQRTEWHTGVHTKLDWVRIPAANPVVLSAGYTFIEIHSREAGAMLDALALSDNAAWAPAGDVRDVTPKSKPDHSSALGP